MFPQSSLAFLLLGKATFSCGRRLDTEVAVRHCESSVGWAMYDRTPLGVCDSFRRASTCSDPEVQPIPVLSRAHAGTHAPRS